MADGQERGRYVCGRLFRGKRRATNHRVVWQRKRKFDNPSRLSERSINWDSFVYQCLIENLTGRKNEVEVAVEKGGEYNYWNKAVNKCKAVSLVHNLWGYFHLAC